MLARIVIAFAGALVVTFGLLLSMDAVTSLFENRSNERFFRISDVLPKPDPGRPERPEARQSEPEIGDLDVDNARATLPIEAPAEPGRRLPELSDPEIPQPDLPSN